MYSPMNSTVLAKVTGCYFSFSSFWQSHRSSGSRCAPQYGQILSPMFNFLLSAKYSAAVCLITVSASTYAHQCQTGKNRAPGYYLPYSAGANTAGSKDKEYQPCAGYYVFHAFTPFTTSKALIFPRQKHLVL